MGFHDVMIWDLVSGVCGMGCGYEVGSSANAGLHL
jgi:hypothetical protein